MDMTRKRSSALIIYFSIHGTTRKAINTLAASLKELGVDPDVCQLNGYKNRNNIAKFSEMISSYPLIIIGSPTYFHHAPPVFADFINSLPDASPDQSVALLSTFGGVSRLRASVKPTRRSFADAR